MRIRRGLSSRHLRCGCVAGVYETYRDEIVLIIDAPSSTCPNPGHTAGSVIPVSTLSDLPPGSQDTSNR